MQRLNMIGLALVMTLALLTSGCQNQRLAPDGPYKGDAVLYNAENAINTAHETFLEFYRWEKQFRDVLPVEVSRAADYMRLNEEKWITTANNFRDAYANTPTEENKDKLQLSVNLIRTALREAAAYMLASQKVAPNAGLKNVEPVTAPK